MTTTLVTGATRGVGRETARRLVVAGHTVWLGARDLAAGELVAAEIGCAAVQIDVTDPDSVTAAVRTITAAGDLDVLVNNAGIAGDQQPPGEASIADLERVLSTNVVGAVRVLDAFAPLLEASAVPVVVNVSSAVGSLTRNASPDSPWQLVAYPVSKAALNMVTIQYAKTFRRWRVNSATPGLTATDFSPLTGGRGAPVEEAVEVVVQLAMIGTDGPTGGFFENAVGGSSAPVPW